MKIKFWMLVLGACVMSSSLYARVPLKTPKLPSLRTTSIVIKPAIKTSTIPTLNRTVTAAVRGQLPALRRLNQIQAYRGTVQQWRAQNPVLLERLERQGVLVKEAGANASYSHIFTVDGVTWYEGNELLAHVVQEGRYIRFEGGNPLVSLYKGGPEFKFYDEELFKELDHSRSLGIEIVEGNQMGSWHDWVGVFPKDMPGVKIFEGDKNSFYPGATVSEGLESWNETVLSNGPAFSLSSSSMSERAAKSVADVNDLMFELNKLQQDVALLKKSSDFSVVFCPYVENGFLLQDSYGVLHSPQEFEAVIKAERARLVPDVRRFIVTEPFPVRIEIEDVDFEEVF